MGIADLTPLLLLKVLIFIFQIIVQYPQLVLVIIGFCFPFLSLLISVFGVLFAIDRVNKEQKASLKIKQEELKIKQEEVKKKIIKRKCDYLKKLFNWHCDNDPKKFLYYEVMLSLLLYAEDDAVKHFRDKRGIHCPSWIIPDLIFIRKEMYPNTCVNKDWFTPNDNNVS